MDGIIDRNEFDKRRNEVESRLTELEPQPDLPPIHTDFSDMYSRLANEKKVVFWKAFLKDITVHRDRKIDLSFHTTKVLAERMGMIDHLSE